MTLPFVGPSYNLETRKASVQRSVNLFLAGMETQSKAAFILQSAPGLTSYGTASAACRGVTVADGRMFAVFGATLYEIGSDGTLTSRGTLATGSGRVSMEYGISQLVIVDGTNGYVLTLATNAFARVADPDWPAAIDTVGYMDGFFVLTSGTNQQAYITAIDDATAVDALDFASTESRPDNIVTHVVNNREILYFGELTTERWFNAGNADYPFSRDTSANAEVGCAAAGSAKQIDNSVFWIGRDKNGLGFVLRDIDRQPRRISTVAIEEQLQSSTDLASAIAYTYQMSGRAFYCINAPGLASTLCYEVTSQAWHERCDLDPDGNFTALRVTHACFAYGYQWAFDATGAIYRMSMDVNTYAGSPLKRSRISPNDVTATRMRQFFTEFSLDCTTGEAPQGASPIVELSWSDDGGYTWGNPVQRSAGAVGEYLPRVVWNRLGCARDRVWRVDCSDDTPFSIIDAQAVTL